MDDEEEEEEEERRGGRASRGSVDRTHFNQFH